MSHSCYGERDAVVVDVLTFFSHFKPLGEIPLYRKHNAYKICTLGVSKL